MITQMQLDAAVREAYDHAHACCHYGPTDRSFPVGEDGIMDCTGQLGFVKTEDIEDVYRYHCFVQWVQPQWVGSEHVHHTYYSLGGDGKTISKYDTGAEWRLRAVQPFEGVSVNEWGDGLVFKCAYKLVEPPENGIYLRVGG